MTRTGAVFGLALLIVTPVDLAAAKKKPPAQYGVIGGTVFRENGLSLPGAAVSVVPMPEENSGGTQSKPIRSASDSRGEFAIRVPAGSMRYTVRVQAKGYRSQEKEVSIEWDQRVDVFFRLAVDTETGAEK